MVFVCDVCSIKPRVEKGECAMSFQLQGCSMLSTPQWQCPERKERCVPTVVVTSYCVTAPHNMSYCGQTEACDSITAWHASLPEHADCIMQSSSMVRLVPAILCSAALVIASVILLYIKMQTVIAFVWLFAEGEIGWWSTPYMWYNNCYVAEVKPTSHRSSSIAACVF
jgi:hypothetical protein